jgi:hypothetical protein
MVERDSFLNLMQTLRGMFSSNFKKVAVLTFTVGMTTTALAPSGLLAIPIYAGQPPYAELSIGVGLKPEPAFSCSKDNEQATSPFNDAPAASHVRVEFHFPLPNATLNHPAAGSAPGVNAGFSLLAAATIKNGKARQDVGASIGAAELIKSADLPDPVRSAMLTVLRQHPDEDRWSGQSGRTLFGIAAKSLPESEAGRQAAAVVLNVTHSLAVQELLKAKLLLDRYAEAGLSDSTTLCQAVVETAGKLNVVGRVKTLKHESAVRDGFAVSYVIADSQDLTSQLFQTGELQAVKARYRDIMHAQARDLMNHGNCQDALFLWQHLHSRKLVSQSLYLDAARCFRTLKQNKDAFRVLSEAVRAFADTAPAEFFEQAGDIALSLDLPPAQQLAAEAYKTASSKMLNSVTPSSPPLRDGLKIEADQ